MEKKFAKLRLNEWAAIQNKAKLLWMRDVLGERPTFDNIKKTLPNQHQVTLLEWLAVLVLVVLTVFTSFKVGALAVPFATQSLDTLSQHTYLAQWVQDGFILVTALLFMLLATPSVIYFKLLSNEPEIKAEKRDTRHAKFYTRISLDYITPRLPALTVYLSVAWLVVISAQLPGTPFEQYLPVVVEVALAMLVGNIMRKRTDFNKIVWDALKERTTPYDARLAGYEHDGSYLRVLYSVMREEVAAIKRPNPTSKRNDRPNAWLEEADDNTLYQLLSLEYRRLTSGERFAEAVVNGKGIDPTPVAQVQVLHSGDKRKPPAGDRKWTADTLLHDLRVRGINPTVGYSEADIAADYETGFNARGAWRAGAREEFTKSS